MPSAISGAITLMIAAIAIVHFVSTAPGISREDRACEQTQVYRWSDRACYTPQGE
ncbi:MAG: hypothetical protein KME10_05085 [Plectolyngbya sp. WJT66-NPBG17]|nr:hypothetical protein [Plectolyngbya sp. WJT66-NPBG17]